MLIKLIVLLIVLNKVMFTLLKSKRTHNVIIYHNSTDNEVYGY